MANGEVPLVVCVSADIAVRERVVRRLEDCGAVLICADMEELRAMLFPQNKAMPPIGSVVADSPNGRTPPSGGAELSELVIDSAGHQVTWRGRVLPLTRLERDLLTRLASQPVGVWTYQRLFDSVWGKAYLGDSSILHSAIKRLRAKLRDLDGGLRVETVRGVGYRLAVPPSPDTA